MFIESTELKSVIYQYQIDEITEADDDIIYMAITAAIDEVKSYLQPNNKKEWQDGRLKYDVATIFSATGTSRNALLVEMTKNIAIWYLVRLCNVDIVFDNVKDRYDRAIDWLKKVNKGDITLTLPTINEETNTPIKQAFRFSSRTKFNHE